MSEQTVAAPTVMLSQKPDYSNLVDDRNNFEKIQGHQYYAIMPADENSEESQIAKHAAELEKRAIEESRSRKRSRMTPAERSADVAKQVLEDREQRAATAETEKDKATAWNAKYEPQVNELRAMEREIRESGNGWRVSELYKIQDTLKQLQTVGSDENTNQRMYQNAIEYFDARQTEIETKLKTEAMGHLNKAATLFRRANNSGAKPELSAVEKVAAIKGKLPPEQYQSFRAGIDKAGWGSDEALNTVNQTYDKVVANA